MLLRRSSLFLSVFLLACASLDVTDPPDYTGAIAFISDSVVQVDSATGKVFYVEQIDGRRVDSAAWETRLASEGRRGYLSLWSKLRVVPARQLKLRLVASHITSTPIHEIASRAAGTFYSVEGEVVFTPKSGGKYVVKGELAKEGSRVWLEDEETLLPVTPAITSSGR